VNSHRPRAELVVTVDLVIFTVRADRLHILLIERGNEPFAGQLALPGGFVRPGEDLPQAASRELREETGINAESFHLEQVGTYGQPDRDPRERVITVVYLAIVPGLPTPKAGSDASAARWVPVDEVDGLAFDHDKIVSDALERARAKLEYTTLAASFCPGEFTITDLRRVYEAIWGRKVDARNFHRKVMATKDFVVSTGEKRTDVGRPAVVYRQGGATVLYPPMLRRTDPPRS
jgi:8-oxo-dGTP diphosphatase